MGILIAGEIENILPYNYYNKFEEEEAVFLQLNSMRIFNVKFYNKEINIISSASCYVQIYTYIRSRIIVGVRIVRIRIIYVIFSYNGLL